MENLFEIPLWDSNFSSRVQKRFFKSESSTLSFSAPLETSILLDHTLIQESWAFRNVFEAREIAKKIVQDNGEINVENLTFIINELTKAPFSLMNGQEYDGIRRKHILYILNALLNQKEMIQAYRSVSRPISHKHAEQLIRETLFLSDHFPITDSHARLAAVTALLTSLRQNVGSCFATAPAILIQQQQPYQFLKDMAEILATGRLRRIIDGVEYAVPLNTITGLGDLKKPFHIHQFGNDPLSIFAQSPGFITAFEEVLLIDSSANLQEKQKKCFELFIPLKHAQWPDVIDPEKIIRAVLYHVHGISEAELKEFELKPKERILGDLVIQSPFSLPSKEASYVHFLKDLQLAKKGFKKITENALLKAWEFTLASFSEIKADYCRWNLQISLGFDVKEPFGIGECIYKAVQNKIEQVNKLIEEIQINYQYLYNQTQYLEGRARNASSENELGWVQAEYQIRRLELNQLLNQRDEQEDKGKQLANLYSFLLNHYFERFKDFFQEIYDAEMHDISVNSYDDSPAGFRLLYKHGRTNTSVWSKISSGAEFVEFLAAFFVNTETEISNLPETSGLQKELTEIVTSIVMLLKTSDFLEAALNRVVRANNLPPIENPLENLEKLQKKPWAYVSGGTMSNLISVYFGLRNNPGLKEKWIETEKELLVFYLDVIKEMPLATQKAFISKPQLNLLAYSPTHAFLIKPGFTKFRQGWWENDTYTYSWIRDNWIFPSQRFLEALVLDTRAMHAILDELIKKIPQGYQSLMKTTFKDFPFKMNTMELYDHVIKTLSYERWIRQGLGLNFIAEELSSLLFSLPPFFPEFELWEHLSAIYKQLNLPNHLYKQIQEVFNRFAENLGRYRIFSSKQLREIAKTLFMLGLGSSRTEKNYAEKIPQIMQEIGLAMPRPILFADTNWIKNYFGFLVSPTTNQLELWRFDENGQEGRPILQWKQYLNGSQKIPWGVYTINL